MAHSQLRLGWGVEHEGSRDSSRGRGRERGLPAQRCTLSRAPSWGGRRRGACMKLTLSGTQENFSEIIKGTPSIAAKGEKKRGNGIIDTADVQECEILTQTLHAALVSGASADACPVPALLPRHTPGEGGRHHAEAETRAVRAGRVQQQDRDARGLRGSRAFQVGGEQ